MEDISKIIGNLVALSPGKENETVQVFDLGQTIKDICNLIGYEARKRKINLLIDIVNDEILINADKLEIKQLILNLIKNSFEALGKEGTVTVQCGLDKNHSKVVIKVSDNGPGLADEELQSVFSSLFQFKNRRSEFGNGPGNLP